MAEPASFQNSIFPVWVEMQNTSRPQLAVSSTSKPPSHVLCTRVGLENFDLNDNSGYLGAL